MIWFGLVTRRHMVRSFAGHFVSLFIFFAQSYTILYSLGLIASLVRCWFSSVNLYHLVPSSIIEAVYCFSLFTTESRLIQDNPYLIRNRTLLPNVKWLSKQLHYLTSALFSPVIYRLRVLTWEMSKQHYFIKQ